MTEVMTLVMPVIMTVISLERFLEQVGIKF